MTYFRERGVRDAHPLTHCFTNVVLVLGEDLVRIQALERLVSLSFWISVSG